MGVFFGVLYKFFAFIGFLLLIGMISGGTWDYLKANKNINWEKMDRNNVGYVKRGIVFNIQFDCASNFRGFEIFSKRIIYKDMGSKKPAGFEEACKKLTASTAVATTPATPAPAKTPAAPAK